MSKFKDFNPEYLRELSRNFPDVIDKLNERKEILHRPSPTGYQKPSPELKPDGWPLFRKVHSVNKGSSKSDLKNDKHQDLVKNEKDIQKALDDNLQKLDAKEEREAFNELDSQELVLFIEEGQEALEQYKFEKELALKDDLDKSLKLSEKEAKEIFDDSQPYHDFDDNSKDMSIDKNTPEPSDDYE